MYWQKRFERLKDAQMALADEEVKALRKGYARSLLKLKKDVNDWYVRYARENKLTYAEAKKMLNRRERAEFQMTLEEYIKEAKKKDLDPQHLRMLKNASIRVRLDRSQEIYVKMAQEVEKLAKAYDMRLDAFLQEVYKDTAYKTAYETQRLTKWTPFREIPANTIEQIVRKPWAADGKDFSSRIWENKQKLLQTLESELSHALIAGVGTTQISQRLAKRMNVSFNTARRLVETEAAYIQERAALDTYDELGVEQFQILATLDAKTSEVCRTMDGKVFDKKDAKSGVTVPPFHCYCRSTTVPYLGKILGEMRAARDEKGKSVRVENMAYEEWKETYVKPKDDEWLQVKRRSMVYYNQGINNEPLISAVVKTVSADNQMELAGWDFRVKGKESYMRKIQNRYENGQTDYQASDIVRYTMVTGGDTLVSKLKRVTKDLAALGYETIEVNNFWLDTLNPYNGINTVVKTPNGQRFELQYHTPESLEVKEKMHALYEKKRVLQNQESEEALKYDEMMQKMAKSLKPPKNIEEVASSG